jgi:O-acetyl-ADP-ribose deacetylase (regulator of RNase III)
MNIWDYYSSGYHIVIPTNECVKSNGEAVMGAGLALQAKIRFQNLAKSYGLSLKSGQSLMVHEGYRVICVPTKGDWRDKSTVARITAACYGLAKTLETHPEMRLAIPALGCGLGGLNWEKTIKPLMTGVFSRFGERVALLPPQ